MATSNQEKMIFSEIQKKLFYMIPEKWDAIFLYASIIEEPFKKPVGEMYFYYLPKGILKRKPVNVYQIPGMFNIDEESYNELIQELYSDIKNLRKHHRESRNDLWTNLTISIENFKFKIEYNYDDIKPNSEFTPYERHIIWRYKYLKVDKSLLTKEEQKIIEKYNESKLIQNEGENTDTYVESIYQLPVRNIIDYEKTLTVEAAIASQRYEQQSEKNSKRDMSDKSKQKKNNRKDIKKKDTSSKKGKTQDNENQILFDRVNKMKKTEENFKKIEKHPQDFGGIEDNMILNSDFMTQNNHRKS